MSSKTLGLIFAYWTGDLKSKVGDGYIQLPFNIEKFCAANDEKIKEITESEERASIIASRLREELKQLHERLSKADELLTDYNNFLKTDNVTARKIGATIDDYFKKYGDKEKV